MIKLEAVIYLGLSKEVRALKSYFLDQDLACTPLAFKIEDREIYARIPEKRYNPKSPAPVEHRTNARTANPAIE
ncbi:MAG: hypothetical protein AB8V81_02745 [Coxiella endosymbiont of Dermacentor nuttalli]